MSVWTELWSFFVMHWQPLAVGASLFLVVTVFSLARMGSIQSECERKDYRLITKGKEV